jgi:ketosteroid isomerase-like protein
MSQQNIEVTRAIYTRWNSGERPDPAEFCDPAVELESPFASVFGEPYRGYAGIEQWIRDVDEQFSEWRVEVDDIRAVGDTVITIGRVAGRGHASGISFERPTAWVSDFGADHRLKRVRIYVDVQQALEDMGLGTGNNPRPR